MNLRVIRDRYPWPDIPTSIQPYIVSLDGGGRHLVDSLIEKDAVRMILEIGSFLGGSTHRWLACSPYHQVIAVDPWNFRAGETPGPAAAAGRVLRRQPGQVPAGRLRQRVG